MDFYCRLTSFPFVSFSSLYFLRLFVTFWHVILHFFKIFPYSFVTLRHCISSVFYSKTKNRGDVHETHPPGFINKSDESCNRNHHLSFVKESYKTIKAFFSCTQRLQWIEEYGILSVRRRRNSGWWLCVLAHNLSGDVERQFNKSAGAFLFPAGGNNNIYFFIIVAHGIKYVKSFCKKQGKFV